MICINTLSKWGDWSSSLETLPRPDRGRGEAQREDILGLSPKDSSFVWEPLHEFVEKSFFFLKRKDSSSSLSSYA